MPVIREYRPQQGAPGPVQRDLVTPEQLGAAEGRAMQNLGGALMETGDLISRRVEQENTSDVNARVAEANAALSLELQETIRTAEPGDKEVFAQYNQKVDDTLSKIGEEASTPAARQFHAEASIRIKQQLKGTAASGQAQLAGVKAVDDYRKTINGLSAAAMADPSSLQLQMDLHSASIDNLVATGQLPASKAMELKSEGESSLARSTIRGWATLNPEYAKQKLDSGEFNDLLGAEGKLQMYSAVEQEIRGREADRERIARAQKEALSKQQTSTQNEFLVKLNSNELTFEEISNSNLDPFGSGSKEQFIQMMKTRNDPEARLKTDGGTFVNLFTRINLPDGDPKKIVDENELNKYVGNGLSFPDLNRLRDEMQGKQTEAGKIESQLKNQVMDIAKGQLTKSNPLTGFRDPIGDEQMQRFMVYFLDEYSKKRKAGKTSQELLSPDSPDYLGKAISQYQRTPVQIMRDMAPKRSVPVDAAGVPVTTPVQPPRQQGESAAAYLKRTKGGS